MEARVEPNWNASQWSIPTYNRYQGLEEVEELASPEEDEQEYRPMDVPSVQEQSARRKPMVEHKQVRFRETQAEAIGGAYLNFDTAIEHPSENSEEPVDKGSEVGDEETSTSMGSADLEEINLAHLSPAKLLVLTLEIDSIGMARALIDTGSTNNLIRASKIGHMTHMDQSITCQIQGLGQNILKTIGRVRLNLHLGEFHFKQVDFDVVSDQMIGYDLILGVAFFSAEKMVVDLKKRRISQHRDDGSKVNLFFDDQNALSQIVEENVPVYAAKEVQVDVANAVRVPICMHITCMDPTLAKPIYYEDLGINKRLMGVSGIVDSMEPAVYVHMVEKQKQRKHTIRQGDVLGTVSTVLEVETRVEEEDAWTPGDLRTKAMLGQDLTEDEREKVFQLLWAHQVAISRGEFDIGKAKVSPHRIELTDSTPIWMKPRKFSDPINQEVERQCQQLLGSDLIEYSQSPFSAAVVPVSKRCGSLRMCVDYRRLNAVTKTEKFPMPNLTDLVYRAGGVRYFTKLDITKGYYHVPLEKESRKYTAFSTHQNHYQFKTLSFGLKNSGIAFQRAMQQVLAQCHSRDVMCYIDDILITSKDFDGHLKLVGKVLQTLSESGIKVKLAKCEFFQSEVQFLGHVISSKGIKKDPEYVKAISEYPRPTNVTELRQFLGMVNFQRKFVKDCSVIAKPLTELTGGPKKKKLDWNDSMTQSFEQLKEQLVQEVTLTFPEYGGEAETLRLFVDASGVGAGACLTQKQDCENRVIAYASTTFSDAERRYSTIERELTAVRWGVKIFRPFLMGVPFEIWTDHKPLVHLQNMAQDRSKFMRILDELAEYEFVIRYLPGSDNSAADAMSRILLGPDNAGDMLLPDHCALPEGFVVQEYVKGGGDSLFAALILCMKRIRKEELTRSMPEDETQLREEAVDHVLQHPQKYGLKLTRDARRQWRAMRRPGQLPSETVLLAVAALYQVEIWVHHGGIVRVVYKTDESHQDIRQPKLHLQCVSGIHFNPIDSNRTDDELKELVDIKNINVLQHQVPKHTQDAFPEESDPLDQDDDVDEEVGFAVLDREPDEVACHHVPSPSSCRIQIGDQNVCALMDSGAQVNLLSTELCTKLQGQGGVQFQEIDRRIVGIGQQQESVMGILTVPICVRGITLPMKVDFAVIADGLLPCCCLLGAGTLEANNIVLDYHQHVVYFGGHWLEDGCHPVLVSMINHGNPSSRDTGQMFVGHVSLGRGDFVPDRKVRYTISGESLNGIQTRDHVIRALKTQVKRGVPPKEWRNKSLRQFKRAWEKYKVADDLLLINFDEAWVPVLPFRLFVEVCYRTHCQLAHLGRPKLLELVARHFWHPAIHRVTRDVCTTCAFCQLNKVSPQQITPPTLKIQSDGPFDLVALDLLQFPRTSRRSVAVLVAVDHFSKFAMAANLTDKTSRAVCHALRTQIVPHMVGIPSRILTDNGPEFRSDEFEELLHSLNIQLVHSTAYKASSNGAVERVNQTITRILKGLMGQDSTTWDLQLPNAIRIYNQSMHSQLKCSPSEFLLRVAHPVNQNLGLDAGLIQTWKEGHPRFAAFRINEWVAYKLPRIGNRLGNKFKQKYEGPCQVVKRQSNGVTYEIRDPHSGRLFKKHHQSLKVWHTPPRYLQPLLDMGDTPTAVPPHDLFDSDSDATSFEGFGGDAAHSSGDNSDNEGLPRRMPPSGDNCGAGRVSYYRTDLSTSSTDTDLSGYRVTVSPRRSRKRRVNRATPLCGTCLNGTLWATAAENVGLARSSEPVEPVPIQERTGIGQGGDAEPHIGPLFAESADGSVSFNRNSLNFMELTSHNQLIVASQTPSPVPIPLQFSDKCPVTSDARDWTDWDMSEEGFRNIAKSHAGMRALHAPYSTPLQAAIDPATLRDLSLSPISPPPAGVMENPSLFLQWLERSLSLQEDIVAQAVSPMISGRHDWEDKSLTSKTSSSSMPILTNAEVEREGHPGSGSPCVPLLNEASFHGFGEDSSPREGGTVKLEVLKLMKRQSRQIRGYISLFRRNSILKDLWNRRRESSPTIPTEPRHQLMETPNFQTCLPLISASEHGRIQTRSRGPAAVYPNVQARILEYELRRQTE